MAHRRLTAAIALSLALGACSAAPADPPVVVPSDSGPAAAVDKARSVASDLEERNESIDSQMRDPFSPP